MIRTKGYERHLAGGRDAHKEIAVDKKLPGVDRTIAIASGKGGVGKSTLTANLARVLASMGYRVGVLDADIYGPSQPLLWGLEDYVPVPVSPTEGANEIGTGDMIAPADAEGVKVMSIGFFIAPTDALVWRGPMAANALRQLARQTAWGELDYLLVDLPPGTGDVHLSIVGELHIDGAVIVSTPGRLSVADVRRGVEMFRGEGIDVPVLGVVENMAWFTPAETATAAASLLEPSSDSTVDNNSKSLDGTKKYFIFGKGEAREFSAEAGVEFLGEIPIVMSAGSGAWDLSPYVDIALKVVEKLDKSC